MTQDVLVVDLPKSSSQGTVGHVRELIDCYFGVFVSLSD